VNIKLLGKNLGDIAPLLEKYSLRESNDDFSAVITHGGDGSLLGAERDYPGVPKFPIRDAATAPTCPEHALEARLEKFSSGEYELTRLVKVKASVNGKTLTALNDVFLHNADFGSALRYRVKIDGELYAKEVAGDGVCLASPHGSSAYYRSITHSLFRTGLGLAFSNSTEEVDHLVLKESSTVEVTITRGPGILLADNSPQRITVNEGDTVLFSIAGKQALIWDLAGFMCPKCRLLRHPNKLPFEGLKNQ
jgi:NAD+ kinase